MRHRILISSSVVPAGANATITVYNPGTTVAITDTLYQDATSSATYSNPYTHPGGQVLFYLALNKAVDVKVVASGAPAGVTVSGVAPAAGGKVFSYLTRKVGANPVDWTLT